MLDGLRNFARTWIGKVVGAIVLVAVAGFGINNIIADLGGNVVARVGDEEITTRDFSRAYQSQLMLIGQQLGRVPTNDEAVQFGIPGLVLDQLATEAAIDHVTADLSMGVSDARLGQILRSDRTFAGTLGTFDRAIFVQTLQNSGYTEAEYFDISARGSRRDQLLSAAFAAAPLPAVAYDIFGRFETDQRTIDYFVLGPATVGDIPAPAEEELAIYLAENQAAYRTLETRSVNLLALSPESLAAARPVSDAEIEAEYQRTLANYVVPETRFVRQLALPAEAVETFTAGLAAGRSFGSLAQEAGLTPSDMGFVARSQIVDAQLAQAAFSLEAGQFAVIPGIGGQRAVAVSSIRPEATRTLDEVRDQIGTALAVADARSDYLNVADQVEELRAAFRPLPEIAEELELTLHELDVTALGFELTAVTDIPPAELSRVASTIFAAQEGRLPPGISLGANRNVWFELVAIETARDQTLDEVREDVVAAWTAQRTQDALDAQVEDVLARLDAGEDFAEVALALNQFPQLSQPMGRSGDGTPVIDGNVAASIFAGGADHYGAALNSEGNFVVFDVVDIVAGAAGLDAETTQVVEDQHRAGLFDQFVQGARAELGVRVNQQALDQVVNPQTQNPIGF